MTDKPTVSLGRIQQMVQRAQDSQTTLREDNQAVHPQLSRIALWMSVLDRTKLATQGSGVDYNKVKMRRQDR